MLPMSFDFENSAVRILKRDDDLWFIAADVCAALDMSNPTMMVKALDEDERAKLNLGHPFGDVNVVSESGLYTLILRCRDATTPGTLPHRFRRWVTSEVLPAIRRTGRYSAQASDDRITIGKDEYIALLKARITALEGRRRIAFTPDERAEMVRLSTAGMGASDIARLIGRNESSVSTFLRRHRA